MDAPVSTALDLAFNVGPYFNHGEYGILFDAKDDVGMVVKIMNFDVFNDAGEPMATNETIAEFLEVWRNENLEHLPRYGWWCIDELTQQSTIDMIQRICDANGKTQEYLDILDFEIGDTFFGYSVELFDVVGKPENMERNVAIQKIAEGVVSLYEETGELICDYRFGNIGWREDVPVFFDFNLMDWADPRYARFVTSGNQVQYIVNNFHTMQSAA